LIDSLTATRIAVTLEPGPKSNRLRGHLDFGTQLGADPVKALFGHSDECVHSEGPLTAYKVSPDTVEIWFTPGAADCGLVARGRFLGADFLGRWYEPQFSGTGAQGTIRMRRTESRHQ